MKAYLKIIILQFFSIFTCAFIACFTVFKLTGVETISTDLILQVMTASLSTSLPFFIYCSKKELTSKQYNIRTVIHFLICETLMLSQSYIYDWYRSFSGLLTLFFIVLIVYCSVYFFTVTGYLQAKDINDALKKYNKDEEDQ